MTSGTNSNLSVKKGDIVLVAYPYADAHRRKKRPALALEDSNGRGDFAALPITSRSGHLSTVALSNEDLAGPALPKTSWVRTDQIATLNLGFVETAYSHLQPNKLAEILALLCPRLGCAGARP